MHFSKNISTEILSDKILQAEKKKNSVRDIIKTHNITEL